METSLFNRLQATLLAVVTAGLVLLAIAAPVMADGILAALQRGLVEAHLLAQGK